MNLKTSQSAWLRTGGTLALGLPAEDLAALSQPRLFASQLLEGCGQLHRVVARSAFTGAYRAIGSSLVESEAKAEQLPLVGTRAGVSGSATLVHRGNIRNQSQAMDMPQTSRQRSLAALSGGAIQ